MPEPRRANFQPPAQDLAEIPHAARARQTPPACCQDLWRVSGRSASILVGSQQVIRDYVYSMIGVEISIQFVCYGSKIVIVIDVVDEKVSFSRTHNFVSRSYEVLNAV